MSNGTWTQEVYSLPKGHIRIVLNAEASDETCTEYVVLCDHPFTAEVRQQHKNISLSRERMWNEGTWHATTPAQYAQQLLREDQEDPFEQIASLHSKYWLSVYCLENTQMLIRCEHSGVWGDWEQVVICGPAIWMRESDEVDSEGHSYHWISWDVMESGNSIVFAVSDLQLHQGQQEAQP